VKVTGRALVIQTSFLGDTVLTTPLIHQLAEHARVDVVVTPPSAAILAHHPDVANAIVYDKRGADRGIAGFVRLARRLRAHRYAAAYLAQGSMRSAALALAAGIDRRVGFETSAGRRLYTERVPYIENDHHASRLLQLAGNGGKPTPVLRPRLFPTDEDRRAVDALLREAGAANEPLLAVAPGSVWATKRWPFYAELAELIEGRIVIVGSTADRELAAGIARIARARAIDATGRLSLLASAELIRRARAIVTNDSAPLHLASAMGTPTVAIFGPTVPEFGFGPLAERSIVLGVTTLACRPCDRHGPQRCPLGHWRCMREITPRQVAAAVQELLTPLPPSPPPPTLSR
jgi:heptosyltransferase-2